MVEVFLNQHDGISFTQMNLPTENISQIFIVITRNLHFSLHQIIEGHKTPVLYK